MEWRAGPARAPPRAPPAVRPWHRPTASAVCGWPLCLSVYGTLADVPACHHCHCLWRQCCKSAHTLVQRGWCEEAVARLSRGEQKRTIFYSLHMELRFLASSS